ncbi:hypothetical protein [Parasedimentitalea psychrophila]|nr:hypothetical protein [Parasedimentitalea psychrophila]
MKPGFALSLSPDGISLLHRAAGGWRLVGRVALDSSDLDTALEDLRAKAQQLAAGVMFCKLIIPNSQIRYLTLETGLVDGDTRMDMARTALDGATPYPVSELAFDLSQDGVLTHVAAVAIETLEEAESFANTHGFGPTSFVAAPGEEAFLGEPFFGTTRAIRGTVVEPDGIAVVNIGPADIPGPPSASDLDPDPDPTPAAEGQPDKADGTPQPPEPKASGHLVEPDQMDQAEASNTRPIPTPGFSSRRRKASGRAPVLDGANRAPSATDSHDTISAPALLQSAPSLLQSAPSDHPRPDETTIRVAAALQEPSKSLGAATAAQVSAPSVPGHDQDPTPASAADDTGLSIRQQTAAAQDLPPQSRQPTSQAKSEAATGAKSKATAKPAPPPFGLRQPQDVGGKPPFLGPVLVAALLLFMAAVAAWAFSSKTTWFSSGQEPTAEETVSAPVPIDATVAPQSPAPPPVLPVPAIETGQDQRPEILQPQVSARPDDLIDRMVAPVESASQPAGLTGTDIAVLDALRQSEPTDLVAEAIFDAVEGLQVAPIIELSQAAQYAAVGIWQSVPEMPELPAVIGLGDLYVASIDNTDLSQDAVALPLASGLATDDPLDFVTSPTIAGSAFDLDERGLVRATPDGTINPDGVMIFLGRPSPVPPPTPNRPDPQAEAQINEQRSVLARLRPRTRPDDLQEQAERAHLGGLSLAELGQKRPRSRPASSRPANENSLPATEQAIATSTVPRSRPVNFANLVDRAQRNTNNTAPASASASIAGILNQPATIAPTTVTPSIPTSASVARQATMENSINLRKVNLIGVYGTPSNRRALVRLASGRYKKVMVGDKIDGGQVVAIGDTELRYQKGSRSLTLKMPNG